MEKIGLITPHYANNYGAKLQAFALKEFLQEIGYEVQIINRRPYPVSLSRNKIIASVGKLAENRHCRGFIDFENLFLSNKTPAFYDNKDLLEYDFSDFYAVIVGSDQIWRDDYFYSSFEYTPYLDFLKKISIKRIAYAASFGKSTCIHNEIRKSNITQLLKQFNAISVREISGLKILNDYYNVNGVWVADPTLLHEGNFYEQRLNLDASFNEGKIATYILGADTTIFNRIETVVTELDMAVEHIYKPRCCSWLLHKPPFNRLPDFSRIPSVIDWLNYFFSSDYILTDSFHGMVFSILFGRKFVVFNQIAGGSERYTSLLDMLGLSDRLLPYNATTDQILLKLKEPINYTSVYENVEAFRALSKEYLHKALSNND